MNNTNRQEHPADRPDVQTGSRRYLLLLTLGALGVVYGDIGTSPLYAFREAFHHLHELEVNLENVFGVLSLIFWSLVLIISIKYLVFVMRADNDGEGGILALTALITPRKPVRRYTWRWAAILLGLFGTALLYGDGVITPAISVLSAVEGLAVATPLFDPYIIPITIVILVLLFLFQSRGTEKVGRVFGPITLLWFLCLAVLGAYWIARHPAVLEALNPWFAWQFFVHNGWNGFLVLGSVFLVVTGGEALYADMGHFGRQPIRLAWFGVVLPALLLNYFGQGALLMEIPEAVENPFYYMAPEWALYPLVAIATAATVIASQALITGAFSLTMQAVQLGYLPRLRILHTSPNEMGQIYIPMINWALMVSCIALVLAFGTSTALAAAYGMAVTTTMAVTTVLLALVMLERWKWPKASVFGLVAFFLVIDLSFWGANLVKIPDGGWLPLAIGALIFTLMTTWKRGRLILKDRLHAGAVPLKRFVHEAAAKDITRVPGVAIFMAAEINAAPSALIQNMEHNRILHEHVVVLTVEVEEVPHVARSERAELRRLEANFYQVILRYGFMQEPDVPRDLAQVRRYLEPAINPAEATYFLSRERLISTSRPGMARWRERLFAFMSRNASNATDFFRLPAEQIFEVGAKVEL